MRIVFFALLAVVLGAQHGYAQEAAPTGATLILSVPLTHSDWMLRDGLEWGPPGVKHMLDTCKAAGFSRVYWRVLDGGRSLYKSALMDPQGKWDEDNFWNPQSDEGKAELAKYSTMDAEARRALLDKLERFDYGTFDTLAEAVRYGHEIGLEIHAWISINEDDHGWGLVSRFARAHPECRWRKRDGTFYHSQLSFAFPEVMAYKFAIVDEILAHYAVDGLFIDWLRTGDVRDNPQTDADGVADHGYEAPVAEGFKREYGVDPLTLPNGDARWVAYRARPHTEFMRGVRERANAKRSDLPVAVLGANPWCYRGHGDTIDGDLRGLLLDVAAWAREGLIDAAVPAGYYRDGGTPTMAYNALRDAVAGKADVWYYAWLPGTPDPFLRDFEQARALGARQMLLWEADYIDGAGDKAKLQEVMRSHAAE
ncbi:MAG TPA: family 10 glycosylhydrolase [Candidatus Hydrogenedentes bacterium]|nr:family 10 glycosylhydrolase [Candidatus Hydrogenedentota bacterium]HPG66967.1 family 10 glycosylhydrolase [Candidatus Hydrogenedentota bacterium]